MSEFDTNNEELQDLSSEQPEADQTYARHMANLAETLPVIGGDGEATESEAAEIPEAQAALPGISIQVEPKKRRHVLPILLLVLAILAGSGYLAGAVAFMHYFMPNTTVNGRDVSLKKTDEVAQESSAAVSDFSFAVKGDGVELELKADDLKASYDGAAFARAAMAQQDPWTWPLTVTGTHELTVESRLSYDAARLDDLVGSAIDAVNKDAEKPKDAKVSFDKKTKLYKVTEEKLGSTIDKEAALKLVREAMKAAEPSVELGADELVKPEVTSDDEKLNAAVDEVNGCLGATQDLVMRDEVVETVGEELLGKWVKLSKDLEVSFDDKACTAWAQGELSEKLDTCGATRTYTRPDGKKVTVSGGTYGWIIDGADVASQIAENVEAGHTGTVNVGFKQEAAKWNPGGQEWGDKYIDIDLSEQHFRYYDGKKIILESDVVTGGLDSRGVMHSTPTGVYYINSNMRSGNIKLTGEIDPQTKEPIYISYVDYWMPFIDDSHALHDADWRSTFGGEIYKTSGSHGCVNLPVETAKTLYGMVSVGTVVVVHD